MQQVGNAIATLIAGGILIVVVVNIVWRLRKGVSYWSTPAAKFTRAEDPFSFWLSMIVPATLLAVVFVAGIWALLNSATR